MSRDLHPVAWWVWALGLAAAASATTNPLVLLLLVGVAALVVSARRSEQPWARSFRLYLWLGLVIVVVRVVFRLVFGGSYGDTVLLDLPGIPLPGWVLGITLLGPITLEALLAALYDGMRLAAIVICIGAANALANPKRLLRSMPSALYEVGTALVVAVTVLPQLADSVRRVRAAQQLRAGDERRVGRLRRTLVPVLEDALDRSLALAAGMDARGYGRTSVASSGARRTTGALMLAALCALCAGSYVVLRPSAPRSLAPSLIVLGLVLAAAGLWSAGRRADRTTYRADPWGWPETGVAASGLAAAAACWWVEEQTPLLAYPAVPGVPQVAALALVGVLVGLAAAVCAPPPRVVAA